MELGLLILLVAAVALLGLVSLAARRAKQLDSNYFKKSWHQIEELAKSGEGGQAAAIIQADKTLDVALKQARARGTKTAERIKSAEHRFRDKESVWAAHKLRNRLVHETNNNLSTKQANRALASFQRALKDMGAL